MKIRPAGSFMALDESMERVAEVSSREDLLAYLNEHFYFWEPHESNVTIRKYGYGFDERIGWNTHLICIGGKAALFSDGDFNK